MPLSDLTRRTLAQVDPGVAAAVRRVLDAMTALGHPMVAYDGRRTLAQQQALYARGRTRPGPVVTQVDGVRVKSRHQVGLAVDCAFLGPDGGSLTWDGPWDAYGTCAEVVGLTWGGRWVSLVDRPHVEARR